MKTIFRIICFALSTTIVIFQSCSRDTVVQAPPERLVTDTLRGREFEFKDLTWEPIGTRNVFVGVTGSDLFIPYKLPIEVIIRLDASTTWLVVPEALPGNAASAGFLYGQDPDYGLYIYPYPEKYSLLGSKVSVRIKFI